jgi:hypothetical protein
MSILTVGNGQQYQTLAAATAAASDGDVLQVQAGTYTNDFLEFGTSITLQAVGGQVVMNETVQPPNGKAMIEEWGANVTISGFDISGVSVPDGNGAAVRYEGGNLTLNDDYFHDNQEGLLSSSDPNGTITVNHSEFAFNGNGRGNTHNLYVGGALAKLTIDSSYFHDANVGHEIKSRADDTVITNSRILDNNSPSSYSIDLPNGGDATITNDTIEQGPNGQNPAILAYGEEGASNAGTSVNISNDTIVNDGGSNGYAVLNPTSIELGFSDNSVWGLDALQLPDTATGTTFLAQRPAVDTSALSVATPAPPAPPPAPTPTPTPSPTPVPSSGLVLNISEDAYLGDAQFTISVDGNQFGGIQTATASHSAGQSQAIDVGPLAAGQHSVAVSFINDAWGGTPATDRNLYVDWASYNGQTVAGSDLALWSAGTQGFTVTGDVAPTPASTITSTARINVSEDAYLGDAQFIITVDGNQMGGTYTATASHAAGQSQDITITGIAESFTPHDIAVTFLNDAYGGTPSTDRNLYVNSIQFDGQAVSGGAAALWSAGTQHFTAIAPANWTG